MGVDQPVTLVMVVTAFGAVIILLAGLIGSLFVRWLSRWLEGFSAKIDALCTQNEKDHIDIWRRVNRHGHKIKAENGGYATAGVLIEGEP